MTLLSNITSRESIGATLLKKVLLVYILFAISLTCIHMYLEYRRVRNDVIGELNALHDTFGKPLAIAVWDADREQLGSLLDGLVASHLITGVSVTDVEGGHFRSRGKIIDLDQRRKIKDEFGVRIERVSSRQKVFGYQYPIYYSESASPNLLGHVSLFSSEGVIINKLKYQLIYILIAALLKACVLWLVFLWFAKRLLTRPLSTFAVGATDITMENLNPIQLNFSTTGKNEITVLQDAFNQMIDKLRSGVKKQRDLYSRLDAYKDHLQILVDERTDELRKTNINLVEEIKERKGAESKASQYGQILENSLNEIYAFDSQNYHFLFVNRGACINLGYSLEEMTSLMPLDITPDYSTESFEKLVDPLRDGSEEILIFKTLHKRKNLSTYNVEIHLQLMKFSEMELFVAIVLDISEKRILEKQLSQSQKMESIGTLAGGIAHDFNNILSAVMGYTELALDEVEKESSIKADLLKIHEAGTRAKDLVSQILTFARQSDDAVKPIQVQSVAKEVLKFIRSSIPTTIEIKQAIESDSQIIGNATQVHRILMNLCTNAAHAMDHDGGILEMTLKDITIDNTLSDKKIKLTNGNYIEIKISDTGTGIDPQFLHKIFEPYFTTKGPGEGTGMGLATVHGIVETYGGGIFVDSVLDKGTVFTVYLPVTEEIKTHKPLIPETFPLGIERILFVDDEIQIVAMNSRMLGRLGYSVTESNDGEAALELFRATPNDYDLVISDVTMPRMSGDQLATELLKIRADIPIILCTGYSNKISRKTALSMGVKELMSKPIVKADLAQMIREVLDS